MQDHDDEMKVEFIQTGNIVVLQDRICGSSPTTQTISNFSTSRRTSRTHRSRRKT